MPTRGSEKIKEMVRWRDHFEAARDVPIHTITLDTGSLDELGVLDEEDRVFHDLRCSKIRRHQ